jgi:hypothetical protein
VDSGERHRRIVCLKKRGIIHHVERKKVGEQSGLIAAESLTSSVLSTFRQLSLHPTQASQLHSLQSILPQPFRTPSPLATSSKITLDHPLHTPLPYTLPRIPTSDRSDPALPILLNYASDDELVNSLQSSSAGSASTNPFNLTINWTSTIDPALAYLSLRSRPAFTPFLADRTMSRNIERIYGALRPSGLHQRLVSDLLLRNPDPKVLAKIVEMDANGYKSNTFDNLRTSLITAIYSVLPKSVRSTFSRSTNMRISKALVSQGDTDHIPAIFYDLYSTTTWEPEGVWVLLSLILHLTRHQAVEEALPLLQHMIRQQRLPPAALVGKGDPSHPQAPVITVLSIIIRTVLAQQYYERTRHLSSELLGILGQSTYHGPAWELLLEICRVSLVGGSNTEMDFINETLSDMAKIRDSPRLPKSIVNHYVGSVRRRQGAGFFFGIKEEKRPPLTAGNILRLASLREARVIRKLSGEIQKLPESEWAPCRDAFESYKRPQWAQTKFGIRTKVGQGESDK